MGEALLVVVCSTGGSQDWHIFTFQNVSSGEAPSMPHMLKSHIEDAKAADKAEGRSCYMPTRDVTGLPKKTESKDKSGHGPKVIKVAPRCTSLFYGRTQKNNPLRVLLNILKSG